jgi:hypothetical protein
MTQAEWLACADPTPMLEFLTDQGSPRKLRLFGVACCRRFWHLLDDEHCKKLVEVGVPLGCDDLPGLPLNSCRKAIEMAERVADEPVSPGDLRALSEAALRFQFPGEYYCACYDESSHGPFDGELVAAGTAASAAHAASLSYVSPGGVAWEAAQAAGYLRTKEFGPADESGVAAEGLCHCDILRDIFGNPFRPVTLDPAWRTPKVKTLAQAIYDDRTFERMPELADALAEAGSSNQDILSHCRGPGPHVRGCWVVDLVLGKE